MYLSVVVTNYNGDRIIEQCLSALFNQTLPGNEYEVIIVDDCSTDKSRSIIAHGKTKHANLKAVYHETNQGRCVARNSGIKAATGDVLLLLDNDIIVCPNFLEIHKMIHAGSRGDNLAVIGNLSYAPEYVGDSNFGRYMNSRYIGNRPEDERKRMSLDNLPSRCFAGGISSVRRESVIAVGMFDETIKGYGGEDELMGHLLHQAGVKLVFAEDAKALHYDTLSIKRYKLKIKEIFQGGYRHILARYPDYFEGTMVRYLLPVSIEKDDLKLIVTKILLAIFLNRAVVFMLEWWLIATDRIGFLSFNPLYRVVMAGWGYIAVRSKEASAKLVEYGKDA